MEKRGRRSTIKKMSLSEMGKKLPPELEMDVLSRLPVKSLLRFRCVSKEWLRLLTLDTHFINNMHLPRSLKANSINPYPSLISLNTYTAFGDARSCYLEDYIASAQAGGENGEGDVKPTIYFDLPIRDDNNRYEHVGICNGLVCSTIYEKILTETCINVESKLFIWNPLTRDHITLCLSPPSKVGYYNCEIFGFGFHQATNEYKVVRMVFPTDGDCQSPHISVYTLGKTWRTLGDVRYYFTSHISPITIHGAPHWLARSGSNHYLILTFDVKVEVFREIPLPVQVEEPQYFRFTELGGLLGIVISSIFQIEIEMWIMKEYGVVSSWTKQFKITQSEIPKKFGVWNPISIACKGKIRLSNGKLLYHVFPFAGSLVSPMVINGGAKRITATEEIQSQH